MKKHLIKFTTLILLLIILGSCETTDDAPETPDLPPVETLAMNFSDFKVNDGSTKSALHDIDSAALTNWGYSALNVGFWNLILTVNLAVPVTAFSSSFQYEPEYLGNSKWEWSYTVAGFASQYSARLTGELRTTDIKWEMYVTKTGAGAFNEVKWFEGTSALDGNSGTWSLNRDPENLHAYLKIYWEKSASEVGKIKYEYVQEVNDQGETDLANGSYIEMELQESEYDATYDIHVYNETEQDFVDINIEWSRTEYFGHVKSPTYFGDPDWHCWDSTGANIDCN